MKFNVIAQDSPNFAAVKAALESAVTRFDYNELARAYNGLAPGAILEFEYSKAKIAMLAKQLEKRGLKRDQDYTLVGATNGDTKAEVAFVTRLTETAAGIVSAGPRGPRGPRKPKAEAAATGTATAAAPAKPKSK